MAIGERISYFRNKHGLTQKALGKQLGFPEKSADVRMAQYETGTRTPKAEITGQLAELLDVSTDALKVPEIDSFIGLMHTFFALEDIYGLHIDTINDEVCLRLNRDNKSFLNMFELLSTWNEQYQKLQSGEITQEEYDHWRYYYPKFDTTIKRVHIPSVLDDINSEDLK